MTAIDQINTPQVLHVVVPPTAMAPGFSAKATLDRERSQYYASAITMEHMNVRLTSAKLAETPIQKTMAPVLRTLLAAENPALMESHQLLRRWATGKQQRAVARRTIDNPCADTLSGAALVYRFAKLAGEPPVKAVARAAGIERGEAWSWLKTARQKGIH